ncbi:f0479be8-3645-434c-928a-42e2085cb7b5 [Sclerotinia trifoliorum]|uniref:F0479be8-3645-434c-928a-42e2085cb7b5 n=1 Tax=Sclerotinia trifoliorum TaxID=28548 RepID=A0A8H2ZLH6_9HELO|nr:f0479be8-3645-434c-928a-42e2085cb7b5 [Sclerotinia trifoliorum]
MAIDVQQRRARNIGFGAILFLIVIWTVKLSNPNRNVIEIYSNHTNFFNSSRTTFSLPNLFLGEKSNATVETKPATDEFGDYFNGTIFNKVAVIIEDSYRPEVIPLVLHFGSVLGPAWPILIYTSIEEVGRFSTSAALSRYLTQGLIQIRNLPQSVLFTDLKARNKFMTDAWLWENIAPAEHILLFNSDSMLCSNAATSVDDFFAYDLIGTPVKDKGHRGGLSLRKRSSYASYKTTRRTLVLIKKTMVQLIYLPKKLPVHSVLNPSIIHTH